MDEFYSEAAGFDHITGFVGDKFYLVGNAMLFQLQLNQTAGHGSCVDGAVDLLHAVGNRSNVVFVAMGNKHTP